MTTLSKRILKLLQSYPHGNRTDTGTKISPSASESTSSGQNRIHKSTKNHTSLLNQLPTELILHIATYLPLSSAAAFALCSHSALAILGTQYWSNLREPTTDTHSEHELFAFLSFLAKDLLDYVPCYSCMLLHHYPLNEKPISQQIFSNCPCRKDSILGGVQYSVYPSFEYNLFQRTMKSYRLGISQQSQLGISILTDHNKITDGVRLGFTYQSQAHAKIVNGSFILRVQQWVLIPPNRTIQSLSKYLIYICPHFRVLGRDSPYPNGELKIGNCNGLETCGICATEWEIDISDCGEAGYVAIVTKWIDLGEGRNIWDRKWSLRLEPRYTGERALPDIRNSSLHILKGAIYEAFEGEGFKSK